MTYYNNYEILTEADEQQTPQVSPERFDTIMDDYVARDKQRSNLSVKLKLTHSLFDAIDFPSVPANFKNIMKPTFFPDKFKNVNNMLDPDPSATINNATDFAVKSFSGLGTLSLAPKQQKNESIEYDSNNVLNETALASLSYQLGKIAGVVVSDVVGGGIVGVASGVVQTAGVPIAATAGAAFGLGALVARLSPDNAGNYHEDDKKLLQKYGLEQNNGKISNNKDVIQAIDNYINNIQAVVRTLLLQVASKSSKAGINKLMTTVNKLNAGALGKATEWIDAHKEEIVKYSEYRAKNEQRKYEQASFTNNNLIKLINWLQAHPDKETAEVRAKIKKLAGAGPDKLANISQSIVDILPTDESINFDFVHVLNEDELTTDDNNSNDQSMPAEMPEFNADIVYETVLRNIQESVNQILEADKEEWPKVIWAKERMQELKKGASEQINKQIEIVCRMGNGESMPKGLSGTVTDFIVKHPMRAENLKALWKRHEADLDLRIQRRIEAITNPTGPCEAVYTFLQTTYPTLMAMMITYKALLAFMRENDSSLMRPMDDTYKENVKKETQIVKDSMINNFKLAYDLAGGYLNKTPGEATIVYDLKQNIFTSELNYGGAIVYQMLKQNKRKDIAQQYSVYADNFDELLPKNADIYFKKMGCVLSECGKVDDATSVNKLIKLMEAVGAEKEQMQKVIEKINASKEKIKAHRSEHLNNLLKLILATRGEFVNYYKDCGGADEKQWKDIKALMNEHYIYEFQHKDDKGNLNKKDKQDTKHDVTSILAKYDQALAKEGFDIKTLIDSVNQEEYFNVIFNIYYNCFFINLLTNIKDKPNLTFIDYDVLITILDMMSSNLPKLVSSEMDVDITKLSTYAQVLRDIVKDGYEPDQQENDLFGYPEVKPEEIDKYKEINNVLNDEVELSEDKEQQNNGVHEQFAAILKDVLNDAWTLPEKITKAGLKIDDKYKLDVSNEYVQMLIERCRDKQAEDEKLYNGFYDFITNNINNKNFSKSEHADEMLDQVRIVLHNGIVYTYYQFYKSIQNRIDFDDFWTNKVQIIKTTDKTLNLTLEQICRMIGQVQTWLNSPTQVENESGTRQIYEELKNRCSERFNEIFKVKFDFGKFGELQNYTSQEFKNSLGADADKIISALMQMFSDINNADKIFQTFFGCVCWVDNNQTNSETPDKQEQTQK